MTSDFDKNKLGLYDDVNTFLEQLNSREIKISSKARTFRIKWIRENSDPTVIPLDGNDEDMLATFLAQTIIDYKHAMWYGKDDKLQIAGQLMGLIDVAYANDMIEDGSALIHVLDEKRKHNEELEKLLALARADRDEAIELANKHAEEIVQWQSKYAECRELYDRLCEILADEVKAVRPEKE